MSFRDHAARVRLATVVVVLGAATSLAHAQGDLPRRGALGIMIAPFTPEAAAEHKLSPDAKGVFLQGVAPDGAAAKAGLAGGDLVVELNGVALDSTASLEPILTKLKAGDTVKLAYLRAGERRETTLTLGERPRETSPDFTIEYGSVTSNGARLRTILTRPSDDKQHPAVFLIQGITCISVDNLGAYTSMLHDLTREGYVTFRVEKPGMGDSEGGPCGDCDFKTEGDAYRDALLALKKHANVDPENVFIVGHSMGGVFGPVIAAEVPVRGVAVYGTAVKTWFEYTLENVRRQAGMAGANAAQLEEALRREIRFQYALLIDKKTPEAMRKDIPDLEPYVRENFPNDKQMYTRHYTFFHQLQDVPLGELWGRVDADVLAVWGASDFVTCGEDHQAIADAVNRARPGKGKYLKLDGIDHFLTKAATPLESMQSPTNAREPSTAFTAALKDWLKATKKSA